MRPLISDVFCIILRTADRQRIAVHAGHCLDIYPSVIAGLQHRLSTLLHFDDSGRDLSETTTSEE